MLINTSCEDCSFAIGKPQTGCRFNYVENFINKGGITELVDDYYILHNHVCPFRTYGEYDIEEVCLKATPPVNFVVFHYQDSFEDLNKSLSSIIKTDTFTQKGNIIVVYNTRNRQEIVKNVMNVVPSYKVKFVSILDDDIYWLDQAFASATNGYITFIHEGFEVPENFFHSLRIAIHQKLWKVAAVKGVDEQDNLRTIMCAFVKLLRLDTLLPIEEKIQLLLEEQGIQTKMVFTWEEINATDDL